MEGEGGDDNFVTLSPCSAFLDTIGEVYELLEEAKFQKMGVGTVAPSHCTGNEAMLLFRELYEDNFVEAVVGKTLHV
jgi:metal-dependent hydrolase (beta-lactamase superfamily II)